MTFPHIDTLPPVSDREPGVYRWTLVREGPLEIPEHDESRRLGITLMVPGSVTDQLVHPIPEFVMVVQGELLVTIDGNERTIGAGQFVLIPAQSTHSYRNVTEQPARMLFAFAGDLVSEI